MRTFLSVITAAVLVGSSGLRAEPDPEAKRILELSSEALTKAKHLAFRAEVRGVGSWFQMLPTVKGELLASRVEDNPSAWKFRVTGRSEGTGIEPTEIVYVGEPAKRTWIDFPNRMVLERTSTQDNGNVIQAVNSISIREVFEAQPLAKERACPIINLEPAVDLDGVKCDVVFVDQGKDLPKGRWFIAQTDRLPRKVEQIIQGGGLDDKRVWTLTQVKLDVEPPAGTFAISTPDGFTFSPAIAAAPLPTATPVAATPVKRERPIGPNIDDLAPDFELANAAGEKVRLSSLRGSVVVVDFWATWHLPCKKTTAEVQKIAVAYKDKPVKVFGLSVREGSEAAPVKFFKDNNLTYTLLLKGDEPAKAYRVKKYPMLFVIGMEGEVVYSVAGYDDKSVKDITDAIDRALQGPQKPEVKPDAADDGSIRPKAKPEDAGDTVK